MTRDEARERLLTASRGTVGDHIDAVLAVVDAGQANDLVTILEWAWADRVIDALYSDPDPADRGSDFR